MLFSFKGYFRFIYILFFKGKPNTKKYIVSTLFMGIYTSHTIMVHLGLLLDKLLFPKFRDIKIEKPVVIFGNPRSGTTFLHRLMSEDGDKFIFFKAWEMLTPSITMRKCINGIAYLDQFIGNPLGKLVKKIENRVYGNFRHIHDISLDEAEEDEGLFIFQFFSPYIYVLAPCKEEIPGLDIFDRLPAETRKPLIDFYHECVQRQYYIYNERKKTFLSKNPSFTGKFISIYEKYPDAKFIHLVRHPYEAIPSLLSGVHVIWQNHSKGMPKDHPELKKLAYMLIELYKYADEATQKLPKESFIGVNYHELIANPKAVVERIYKHFNMEISKEFEEILIKETEKNKGRKSKHEYKLEEFGITKEEVYNELKGIFEKYNFQK